MSEQRVRVVVNGELTLVCGEGPLSGYEVIGAALRQARARWTDVQHWELRDENGRPLKGHEPIHYTGGLLYVNLRAGIGATA